jgi:ABC-type nitrate/sulfonate/bicarbonate transport system ATPase subunit
MPGADTLHVDIAAKAYGARLVLAQIRFSAGPGEVLALLAPSGTGKTTTLRIVLGLDANYTGTVQRPSGRIGAVFQEPRLLPWLNVGENLRLVEPGLTDSDIAKLLGQAGLENAAGVMPSALSLGMARRVALARALAVEPSLLVMDEPFASLDPLLSARLARAITAHARQAGAAILMATHDLDQALAVADRILVLGGSNPATLEADVPSRDVDALALRQKFSFLEGK